MSACITDLSDKACELFASQLSLGKVETIIEEPLTKLVHFDKVLLTKDVLCPELVVAINHYYKVRCVVSIHFTACVSQQFRQKLADFCHIEHIFSIF